MARYVRNWSVVEKYTSLPRHDAPWAGPSHHHAFTPLEGSGRGGRSSRESSSCRCALPEKSVNGGKKSRWLRSRGSHDPEKSAQRRQPLIHILRDEWEVERGAVLAAVAVATLDLLIAGVADVETAAQELLLRRKNSACKCCGDNCCCCSL